MKLTAEYNNHIFPCYYYDIEDNIDTWRKLYPQVTFKYYKEYPPGCLGTEDFYNLLTQLDQEKKANE